LYNDIYVHISMNVSDEIRFNSYFV
jgi:hypothetical protein